MAGVCRSGTPGPRGPAGPPGEDGITPQFADSSCITFDGHGSAADPVTAAPVLDPNGCNAIQCTSAGLIAPEVLLQRLPSTSPGPVGTDRSVDIDIAHPGGCPDQWHIGARLSPAFGSGRLTSTRTLHGNQGAWLNTALWTRLPEPGRYFVSWDVRSNICAAASHCTNMWTEARVVDNATGGQLAGARTVAQHQFSMPGGTSMQSCQSGTAPITHIVGVTQAMGTRTLRLQGIFRDASGCPGSTVQSAAIQANRTYVTWHKITD